jgi:predicted DNA-binding transcriptional regulator AlpA
MTLENKAEVIWAMDKSELSALLRLLQILALIPISRSTWWAGCKGGRYPKLVKLGPRTTVWRASDITALLETISGKKEPEK